MTREVSELGLTREELLAALIEDSIGYLTPLTAQRHIESWERGDEECFCERCLFVFEGDLQKCLETAARHWGYLSQERRQRLLDVVEKISTLGEMGQLTVSMMWPTMG